jgi:hypothetical protein
VNENRGATALVVREVSKIIGEESKIIESGGSAAIAVGDALLRSRKSVYLKLLVNKKYL